MKITIRMDSGRNNFHGAGDIKILVDPEDVIQGQDGKPLYKLTKVQAKKIEKHFCGISDCRCGSGPVIEYDQDCFGLPAGVWGEND